MEIKETIATLLRRAVSTPITTDHKWNHLLGVELELENVVEASGSPYGAPTDARFPTEDYEDWDEMSCEEQDDLVEEWHAQNAGGCPPGWTTHVDHSLRNGYEFVTTPAMYGEELEDTLNAFYDKGLSYSGGPRTSTHIHVNMMDATATELQSLVMIVYMIEPALYKVVDEGRKYAGYSVALTDMPVQRLRNLLNPPTTQQFVRSINVNQNRERYYGLNFNVGRHGTVEFRYFPGGPTKATLTSWIDLVVAIKNASKKYTPDQLAALQTSDLTLQSFLLRELGSFWGQRFLEACDPEVLQEYLEEINTLRSDEQNPERASTIVYIKEPFFDMLANKLFKDKPEAVTYLKSAGLLERPITLGDIQYYLCNAQALGSIMHSNTWAENLYTVNDFASVAPRIISTSEFTHSESQDSQEIW